VPRICFVNKMDRVGASYENSIESMRRRLGANPIALQLPIGFEATFTGVVDLLTMKAILWEDDIGRDPRVAEIPADLLIEAHQMRERMVEQIAETDEALTLKYLEGEEITLEELKAALRQATITRVFNRCSMR
jgi:elongation factor G